MRITRKDLIRRIASLALIVPLAVALGGAGQEAPHRRVVFTQAEAEMLDSLSAYLTSVRTLKGHFVQIGPQGQIDRGAFYLQRPGKVRFEYDPPNPVLVVSDGRSIAVANARLKTVDRYPLSETPFDFFLADKIDLRHSSAVLAVEIEPGAVTVRARTSRYRYSSNVSFVFSEPNIELRQWTVTDPQGQVTTVSLNGLEAGAALPAELFVLPKKPKPALRR